jgi:hypothetical protein
MLSRNCVLAIRNQPSLLRRFHTAGDEVANGGRSWSAVWTSIRLLAAAIFLLTASGCLATRNWVQDQLNPM